MTEQPTGAGYGETREIDYEAFQASADFQNLKGRFRRFVFPLTIAFMAWFLAYALLAAFAHDLMAIPLLGMNVGLWLGLLQFVSTFAITMTYVSFANKRLDPVTTQLRAELERIEGNLTQDGHEKGEGTR